MTEAGGTTTFKALTNVGPYQEFELKNDSVDDGETITIPTTASYIAAEDQIYIIGVMNEDTEVQFPQCSASYDETNRRFTFYEGSASGDTVRILFRRIQD